MAPESSAPVDTSTEEVRVAMALNGGVSLAVWMGGCAVELDCARRAHLGTEDLAYHDYVPEDERATKERRIYHGLCRAFDRRLSIDVLSGASAGGVNGALLAAAMSRGRRLHPRFVRERWLDLGDLSLLLLDPLAEDPRSLMDGALFHRELRRAFYAVCDEPDPDATGPDQELDSATAAALLPKAQRRDAEGRVVPDLDVTMTDVVGAPLTFTDAWEEELFAREHAPRFRFRQSGDYTAAALAAAARTSASFPLAFEPWRVKDEAAARAGLAGPTWGIDGGLLDNAPIRAALERIPFRGAETRVRRYACYVNADPPQPGPAGDGAAPLVDDVIGYVIQLPRTAPFAGQLYAVREATNRPLVTQAIVRELLTMDLGALSETAEALLPAYRRRRTARSIEELVADPTAARRARGAVEDEGDELPWIPNGTADLELGSGALGPGAWSWGVATAQRILHLLLDLLRDALAADPGAAAPLLQLRADIDARIARLEAISARLTAALGPLLARGQIADAAAIAERPVEEIYTEVAGAAERVLVMDDFEIFRRLFSPPDEEDDEVAFREPLGNFFRRVLAIEVIRRALSDDADVETGQELSFVQLTPAAPTPILTAAPFHDARKPAKPKDKLTGVGLAHFAGFYRRAWRANDFMWGRLDAAARVVDLLLDRPPEAEGDGETPPGCDGAAERAEVLAATVLGPCAGPDERWLVQEALLDRSPSLVPSPEEELLDAEDLGALLHDALHRELCDAQLRRAELPPAERSPRVTELPLARAVCTRAAQLEVLRDELPVLVREAAADGELGSSGRPLDLGGGGLREQIEALRSGPSLPERLIGPGEAVSDLGLRDISQASRVGISMLESTVAPLTSVLGVVRVPALAVSGVVAPGRLQRLAVAAAFSAAAVYLTSRIVTGEAVDPPLSDLRSLPVLLSLVAALAVFATVAVPALQAANGIRRLLNGGRAVALAASGGIAAALLALWSEGGGRSLEQVLIAPGAENPPETIVVFALVVSAGLATLRLPFVGKKVNAWLARPGSAIAIAVLTIAASLALAIAAAIPLYGEIDGGWWRTVSVVLALPGAPLAALWLLTPWRKRG
jgi:hypothetical protein